MTLKTCAYAAALVLGAAQAATAGAPVSSTAADVAAGAPRVLSPVELDRVSAGAEINGSALALALGPLTRADTRTAGSVSSKEIVPGVSSGTASVVTFGRATAPNGSAATAATTSADAPEAGGSQLRIGFDRSIALPRMGFSSSVSASSTTSVFINPLLRR